MQEGGRGRRSKATAPKSWETLSLSSKNAGGPLYYSIFFMLEKVYSKKKKMTSRICDLSFFFFLKSCSFLPVFTFCTTNVKALKNMTG